ncbi:MAG TPA: tetratricopeptide repeat protein [Candidatus Nanoarchaeia archaeon]|nr:tetratricopeptide repeat protein [Candidatus Nanoarchaeia archaeon]
MSDTPIFMYHDIGKGDEWAVLPEQFERQVQLLHYSGYTSISLNEAAQEMQKCFVMTFDDGRMGVFTYAYPFLRRYKMTGTVFVVPSWVGKEGYMTWEQLSELKKNGWSIGNHTLNHVNLTTISDVTEIQEAERIITEKIGKPEHFAYPYGAFNEKVVLFVKKNYATAVTAQRGFDKTPWTYARQWVMRDTSLDLFQKLLKRPKISLCLIVKNEEKNIAQCILSIKDIVDEIIIADTGSTDKTMEIARQYTSNVFEVQWTDFASARNAALKKATGDWVLVLDADEVVDQKNHNHIRAAVNDWTVMGYRIVTRNYTMNTAITGWRPLFDVDPLGKTPPGWYPSVKIRLFQRLKGIDFQGKVHEMVDKSVEAFGKAAVLPLVVHHYGTLEDKTAKREMYSQLVRQKIEDNPNDSKAYFELGVQYKEMGLFPDAEQMIIHSIQLKEESYHQRLNLAVVQQKLGKFDKAIENYMLVLQKNPVNADAYFGLGYCAFVSKEMEKATEYFAKTIEHNPYHVEAYINLGALYEKSGNFEEAERILLKALEIVPKHARAHYNLGVVYEKNEDYDKAVEQYREAVQFNYVRKGELLRKIKEMEGIL